MKVYKKITLVGTSEKGIEDAVQNAVKKAGKSVKGLSWFEVTEIRGALKNSDVSEFQVTLNVGFKVKEEE